MADTRHNNAYIIIVVPMKPIRYKYDY